MSNNRDDIETSAPVPDFFKKFEVKFIHDQAVERAKKALRNGLELLQDAADCEPIAGEAETRVLAIASLQAKLHDMDRPYDD